MWPGLSNDYYGEYNGTVSYMYVGRHSNFWRYRLDIVTITMQQKIAIMLFLRCSLPMPSHVIVIELRKENRIVGTFFSLINYFSQCL